MTLLIRLPTPLMLDASPFIDLLIVIASTMSPLPASTTRTSIAIESRLVAPPTCMPAIPTLAERCTSPTLASDTVPSNMYCAGRSRRLATFAVARPWAPICF